MSHAIKMIEIMSLFGIPTLFAIVCWIFKMVWNQGNRIQILMKAQQAQMRRDLMEDYYRHMHNGYITDRDLEIWDAQYKAYHSLGLNGILDKRHEEILSLPLTKIGE
jgi:hypothetical protein